MKGIIKALSVITAVIAAVTIIPVSSTAATKKVKVAGVSISASAKQVCFVRGKKDDPISQYLAAEYAPEFSRYYYVDYDTAVNFKEVAEKLPELQKLVVVSSEIKNPKYVSKMENLVQLGLHGCKNTEDLSFLKGAENLKKLWYGHSKCEDISAVASLKNLNELSIRPSLTMSDISAVSKLTKLVTLDLAGAFSDITPVSKLSRLKNLSLESGSVKDITSLEKLKKLESLSLAGMREASGKTLTKMKLKNLRLEHVGWRIMAYLEYMPTVENLELYNNGHLGYVYLENAGKIGGLKSLTIDDARLSKCDFVSGLTELESLTLTNNKIADFSALKSLKKLKKLNLYGNYGNDYSALLKLTWLEELDVRKCGVPADFAKKYRKVNPECEIKI